MNIFIIDNIFFDDVPYAEIEKSQGEYIYRRATKIINELENNVQLLLLLLLLFSA
jgi:hypothetical protein